MKCCTICKETKPFFSFGKDRHKRDGFTFHCKDCSKLVRNGYRVPPKPVYTEITCTVCLTVKPITDYYKRCRQCKSCVSHARAVAAASRPVKQRVLSTNPRSVYKRAKRQTDTLCKLRSNIGTSIANALANRGYKKTSNTASILGCSFAEFKEYIASLFTQGMSWENRELWHLDHIIPVSFACNEQELLLLNHHTNLRPLWKLENLSKSSAIIDLAVEHPLYKTITELRKQ